MICNMMPYAEIGASFNNSRFGLLLWRGCFVCCFEFGCIQNIVILPDVYWKLSLQFFQVELLELCLAGIELATSTSITGDVTTNPTTYLNKRIEKDILFGYFSNNK